MKTKVFLITSYHSHNGGTNNLQVTRIAPAGQILSSLKIFTSKKDKAKERAERWAKKNNLELVSINS